MPKRIFKLRCDDIGQLQTQFTVFDPDRTSCGKLVVLTRNLSDFLYYSWKGQVDWNDRETKGRAALREAAQHPRVKPTT